MSSGLESFATTAYFGVNAFAFVDAFGKKTTLRYRIIPEAGEKYLDASIAASKGPNYLMEEIAARVAKAAPDGYEFVLGTVGTHAQGQTLYQHPLYNAVTDFTPVTFLGENTFFIVVHPSVPANTLAELVAYAKTTPKPLNYASGNTYAFVSMAMLALNNKIQLEAIRYKSEPDAMADLLSGRISVMNGTSTSVLAHVKAGRLRALSTAFDARSPLLPEVPSIVEAGQATFPIGPWFALVGPAGLPPETVASMNKAIAEVLAKPAVRAPATRTKTAPLRC